jgi:hypothetical protein
MPQIISGHEFEALKCRFENQTEELHRITLIDLQVFSGYITLQLALGAWLATHRSNLPGTKARIGLMLIDLVLAFVAGALLRNSYKRRKEVSAIVGNCNEALGYNTEGIYLEKQALNIPTKPRSFVWCYLAAIAAAFAGIVLVVFLQ